MLLDCACSKNWISTYSHRNGEYHRNLGGMSDQDRAICENLSSRAKVFKLYEKSQFNFNHFLIADENQKKRIRWASDNKFDAKSYVENALGRKIDTANAITVVHCRNLGSLSPRKHHPLTGWIMCHKIHHILLLNEHTRKLFFPTSISHLMNEIVCEISNADAKYGILCYPTMYIERLKVDYLLPMFTFLSARQNNVNNIIDFEAEIFTQIALQGKLRLDIPNLVTSLALPVNETKLHDIANKWIPIIESEVNLIFKNITGQVLMTI